MPEHQGKQLGLVLVLHVLDYFKKKGFREAILDTDDFRLPAIRTYLKLGFEPVYIGENHRRRWELIMHKLGIK
jgi:mycothiol synthase